LLTPLKPSELVFFVAATLLFTNEGVRFSSSCNYELLAFALLLIDLF